jgi:hypothetical protein
VPGSSSSASSRGRSSAGGGRDAGIPGPPGIPALVRGCKPWQATRVPLRCDRCDG